jgi:hypothetical protein
MESRSYVAYAKLPVLPNQSWKKALRAGPEPGPKTGAPRIEAGQHDCATGRRWDRGTGQALLG